MAAKKDTTKAATEKKDKKGFSAEEKAAMKERAKELKAEAEKADGEKGVQDKIAEMTGSDRAIAERLHAIVKENAPMLRAKLWYGMPAYALDGKIVCFFQAAQKFETRYATFGFNDIAKLDDGNMWAASFAIKELSAADEKKIAALVKKAVAD
jgi:hypothetical protein